MFNLLMRFARGISVIAAAGLSISIPAHAQNWEAKGSFDIIEGPDHCRAIRDFELTGHAKIIAHIALTDDDVVILSLFSKDWSTEIGHTLPLFAYQLDGAAFAGNNTEQKGVFAGTMGHGSGFSQVFSSQFLDRLSQSSVLTVTNGPFPMASLNITDFAETASNLRQCVARVKVKSEEKRQKDSAWEYVEKDRSKIAELTAPNRKAQPVNKAAWITMGDYPYAEVMGRRKGTTYFTVKVGANGRAIDCQIFASDASPRLNDVACSLITQRARFTPATDAEGKPIAGPYSSLVVWQLPTL